MNEKFLKLKDEWGKIILEPPRCERSNVWILWFGVGLTILNCIAAIWWWK